MNLYQMLNQDYREFRMKQSLKENEKPIKKEANVERPSAEEFKKDDINILKSKIKEKSDRLIEIDEALKTAAPDEKNSLQKEKSNLAKEVSGLEKELKGLTECANKKLKEGAYLDALYKALNNGKLDEDILVQNYNDYGYSCSSASEILGNMDDSEAKRFMDDCGWSDLYQDADEEDFTEADISIRGVDDEGNDYSYDKKITKPYYVQIIFHSTGKIMDTKEFDSAEEAKNWVEENKNTSKYDYSIYSSSNDELVDYINESDELTKEDEPTTDESEPVLPKIEALANISKESLISEIEALSDEEKETVKSSLNSIKDLACELFPEECSEPTDEIEEAGANLSIDAGVDVPDDLLSTVGTALLASEEIQECEISNFRIVRKAPKSAAIMIEAQTKEGIRYITGKNFDEKSKTLDEAEISDSKQKATNRFKSLLETK